MAHYILGLGLIRMRQYFLAADALRVALALNPNFEQAHRVLARFYVRTTGEKDKAFEQMQLFREIRQRRKAEGVRQGTDIGLELSGLAFEVDQEGQQIGFDAAPEPLVDKNAVPDDPACCISLVAVLPRSGTSMMMMQMLDAGGLPILTDQKRAADGDNPRGYYELEAATQLRQHREWLNEGQGKAVKVVTQLLPFLPGEHAYRVVFMERDLNEVLQSQHVMLDNLGRDRTKLTDKQLQQTFRQQLHRIKVWLAKQPNIKVLFVGQATRCSTAIRLRVMSATKRCKLKAVFPSSHLTSE